MLFKSTFTLALCFPLISTKSTEPTGPTLEYKIAIGLLDATHHNGSSTRFVVRPELPIHVEENAYFWDARYLPSKDSKGCVNFDTGNKPGNVTICEVSQQHRCSTGIDQLVSVFKHKITFDSGESPSQLVWLCKPPQFCCDFKCCDPSSPYYKMLTGCSFLLLFVPFCIAMYRMTAGDDEDDGRSKDEKDREPSRRNVQESRA